MRRRGVKISIIIIMLLIIISIIPLTSQGASEPELIIDSEFKFFFGNGGGELTITVKGDLAREVRKDIYQDWNLNESGNNTIITDKIRDNYIEIMEDILELNINDKRISTDQTPSEAGVDFDGSYKIIKIERADIRSIEGLDGTNSEDSSKFTIKMDLKGPPVDDPDVVLTDGYIILYALFGENNDDISLLSTDVQENSRFITVGMNTYSDFKPDGGGEVSQYRLIMGDIVDYNSNYELIGYNITDNKKDVMKFESFNFIHNSLILAIFIILFTIIASLYAKSLVKKNMVKKVKILRILGVIFFIILAIIYIIGIGSMIVWSMIIIFFVLNLVLTYGIYEKGWGNLAQVMIRHEDFMKEPPKIDEGPWHERGISNAKVGNFEEAVQCFEQALEAEPENPIIWNDLGFVHRKLGNYRVAIDCFNKALDLRPEYSTAAENLEKAKAEMQKRRRRK